MSRIQWGELARRTYQTGIDQGVLYPIGAPKNPIDVVNFVYNPSGNDGAITGWQIYGTNTVAASVPDGPGHYFKVTKSVAGSQMGIRTTSIASGAPGMTSRPQNTVVTISAEVRSPVGQPLAQFGFVARDDTNSDSNAVGAYIAGNLLWSVPSNGQWTRIYVTTTVRAGRNLEGVYVYKSITPSATEEFHIRNVMVNDGALVDFYDGDTANDRYEYAWAALPHRSASTRRLNADVGVPWDGLTSVDEAGGDSSTAYYVDGRPFLYLPKPKEFSATLKAYTFPDEFAAMMGEVEAADGVFLDSQMGGSFNLSYRTMSVDGLGKVAYKIHLIYNVTVAAPSRSYSSLSNDINPSEFSWDIQAVPVPVPGYRATAHVTIDTRNIEASRLAAIEELIYGSEAESKAALMPDPQTILDLLAFGDTIIITDNGDGTWTAEGSYHNLYMTGDGIFQIDNINTVVNPDGTYVLTTS